MPDDTLNMAARRACSGDMTGFVNQHHHRPAECDQACDEHNL